MSGSVHAAAPPARALVVGIGNPDRGDDGAGRLVARRLAGRLPPNVQVTEQGGDVLALLEMWSGFDTVVLIDAAATLANPGRVHRLEPASRPLPRELALGSTHAFGIAEAVELARSLGMLPARLVVYAVEGESFQIGASLSPSVAAAVEEVVERVVAEFDTAAQFGPLVEGRAHA
jgi:hydrogenase maturation protease